MERARYSAGIEITPETIKKLEGVYFDWRSECFHDQEAGLPGDVYGLLLRLNAELAKSSSS